MANRDQADMGATDAQFVVECGALFELRRQVRVTAQAGRIDDSDFCEIEIGFDPAIAPDNLKEPRSPVLARIAARSGGAAGSGWQPLRSPGWTKVVDVTGKTLLGADTLEFSLNSHRDGLRRYAELLEERVPLISSGEGYVWLHRILTRAIELPFWDELARERVLTPGGDLVWSAFRRTIRFVATEDQIGEMARGGAEPFVEAKSGKLVIAEREVRA